MFGLTLIMVLSIAAIFDLIPCKIREKQHSLCYKKKCTRSVKQPKEKIFKTIAIGERDITQLHWNKKQNFKGWGELMVKHWRTGINVIRLSVFANGCLSKLVSNYHTESGYRGAWWLHFKRMALGLSWVVKLARSWEMTYIHLKGAKEEFAMISFLM